MLIKLPALIAISEIYSGLGRVRQLLRPSQALDCSITPYRVDRYQGHRLTVDDTNQEILLFPTKPQNTNFTEGALVVVADYEIVDGESLNLEAGKWHLHPDLPTTPVNPILSADRARSSWRQPFRFIAEDVAGGIVGLRIPQLGALHAILAHWSVSKETATVVLPTGLGKTETMLAALIASDCHRILVVVPTEALRNQLSKKFETLGLFGEHKGYLVPSDTQHPVVGVLTSRPKTAAQVDAIFEKCNVIVATSQLMGGCPQNIRSLISEKCSHLFIDEAHHAEAPTWKSLRESFNDKIVLQFTATPFRADGQKLEGKFIYIYSLKNAQDEGYFRQIRFREISEYDPRTGDRAIAAAALDELDRDETGRHIVMARVSSIKRAEEVIEIYNEYDRYEAVSVHSKLTKKQLNEAKQALFEGQARIVVCVDMLGEGFDMPELKIAAFHDIRKSLAITLQLAGRFTRAREDLGDPVFIANTALTDVREELQALYSQGPDWNALLPEMATTAIDAEVDAQEFFHGFNATMPSVPLRALKPAASMVVYRTFCTNWTPLNFAKGFSGMGPRDVLYHSLNAEKKTLVVLAATEQRVKWSDATSIRELGWELLVAVWDQEKALLYLHGSNIDGSYKEQAAALCGDSVQLIKGMDVFKGFHGINRLVLNNVGLNEHLGRSVRYTGRMGADVEVRIGQVTRGATTKAVIAGIGYEGGERVSLGVSNKGRIWSHQRLQIHTFSDWASRVGSKLINRDIDSDGVLRGTLKPNPISQTPEKVAISADWPTVVLEQLERMTSFEIAHQDDLDLANVDIEVLPRDVTDPIKVRVSSDIWAVTVRLELFESNGSADFRFTYDGGQNIEIRQGRSALSVAEFFSEHPPIIWFADGSSLEGCQFVELPDPTPAFAIERLRAVDWTGVDIRRESQGEQRIENTIQHKMIETLIQNQEYAVIFDDDGSGEAADIVAIRLIEEDRIKRIDVELYHCKYSSEDNPGGRIKDLYEVCGQAQRSVKWLINRGARSELFTHLLRREAGRTSRQRPTRFERGNSHFLREIKEKSFIYDFSLKVFVIQPGLSQREATTEQMTLLAVTERYLTETYEVPLEVICSG